MYYLSFYRCHLLAAVVLAIVVNHGYSAAASTGGTAPTVTLVQPIKADPESTIELTVDNLAILKAKAKERNKNIVLFLNGIAVPGIYPTGFETENTIEFYLHRTPEASDLWATMAQQRDGRLSCKTVVSIGIESDSPIASNAHIELSLVKKHEYYTFSVLILVLLVVFIWLARSSNIIRSSTHVPPAGAMRPYSIGRTQMAFWFFLIIMAYPFIWLVTGALCTINTSILGLMGISAGTAIGATVIDRNKNTTAVNNKTKLTAERDALVTRTAQLHELMTAATAHPAVNIEDLRIEYAAKKARLLEIDDSLARLPAVERTQRSCGFLVDVLSDANGISFHRFQIFAWTIVLGFIFIIEVFENLRMPEFSDTLLTLMGISSGTYIGFKFPEQEHRKEGRI